MKCPKCGAGIPLWAIKCPCGWRVRAKSAPDFNGPTEAGSAIIKQIRATLPPVGAPVQRERQPGEDDE